MEEEERRVWHKGDTKWPLERANSRASMLFYVHKDIYTMKEGIYILKER